MKGYVRKRGNKYSFTVDIGKDPRTGKRKQKTRSGFKTKKEAQAALAELINSVEKGSYVEIEKKLFNEFALNYFEKVYKNKVKSSTYDRQLSLLNKQLIPWFENVDLTKIDHFLIQDFLAEKMNEFSPAYVRKMFELIRMLMKVAFKWDLISQDVIEKVELPKFKNKEMSVWTSKQVNDYLKFTKHSRYHPIFYLAAYTGLRKGEILALTWDDIDFDKKQIRVNKTLYRIKDEYVINEPKTKNSIRTIYIDDDIIRLIKKQRVKQNLEKMKCRTVYTDHNLVFAQENGDYVFPSAVNVLFRRFIKQSGLPEIRFHDLRHTHATILLQMGVNPKMVADRLGHSSVQITLDVYSHVLPSMQQDLSEQFARFMKSGQNVVNTK